VVYNSYLLLYPIIAHLENGHDALIGETNLARGDWIDIGDVERYLLVDERPIHFGPERVVRERVAMNRSMFVLTLQSSDLLHSISNGHRFQPADEIGLGVLRLGCELNVLNAIHEFLEQRSHLNTSEVLA
jgi:hypothetical protein